MSRTGHRAYRRNREKAKALSDVCWLCGGWINPDLPPDHPRSFSADHVTPVSLGGDNLGPLRAAHRDCNMKRSNRTFVPPPVRHAKHW